MQMVVLSIHLLVCLCLVGLVLLQRSEGGALGMGGGGGSLMSGRGAADALAKMTSVAGGFFLVTSLSLTFLSGAAASTDSRSVFDLIPRQERIAPVTRPEPAQPTAPDPTESSAPQAAETQLASLSPAPAQATPAATTQVAPAPVTAATRAAPLETRPTPASTRQQPSAQPRTTAAATTPRQQPAATPVTTSAPRTQPAAVTTTTPRTQPATTTTPARTQPAATQPTRPLVLPNSSGAATGAPLTGSAESVEVSEGVEAVRRERAGPDQ